MIMQQQSAMNMNMMNHHHHHHPSPAAKTALIMSRYRPIAPKPDSSSSSSSPLLTNPIFQQQPRTAYLKNLWPHPHHLQARPTSRIRRKNPTTTTTTTTTAAGLSLSSLPLTFKRRIKPSLTASVTDFLTLTQWPVIKPLPPPPPPAAIVTATESLVTLPLLIDLNVTATTADELPSRATSMVISPQPIRPVGSSIRVKLINRDESSGRSTLGNSKNAEEVEEEVESESLPAVISDSSNRVRLANSAYKEMVGQPVCPWLDVSDGNRPCRRISGEVKIRFSDGDVNEEAVQRTGFSCWVNIEWGNNEEEKKSVHVFCDVIKLVCDTKNYLFAWRFHTRAQAHAPVSAPAPEEGTCKTSMSSSTTSTTTTT